MGACFLVFVLGDTGQPHRLLSHLHLLGLASSDWVGREASESPRSELGKTLEPIKSCPFLGTDLDQVGYLLHLVLSWKVAVASREPEGVRVLFPQTSGPSGTEARLEPSSVMLAV